ncbi:winged helix DNA-binding protein [Sinorhizobium sp. BG8]|uniref:winged helix DNA-binding protein n=1 Tax=Sinorhizobium sp. BG8 TaxID=2613773 RepID=UPI00193D7BC8|nr:winged helix DNA-binding protein [Sinorhizobium sp. BG8]QRM57494.1 winged helix DNA-binding protein [Sinorhizobium sp. BG8]
MNSPPFSIGPIVSSSHLAKGEMPALSEVEFALTVTGNAFHRWIVRCMAAAGYPGLGHIEVLILHATNHREREKSLSDLCVMLNIEDTHVVTYAAKKLEGSGLITTGRRGKEKTLKVTEAGADACERYGQMREALLVSGMKTLRLDEEEMSKLAALMRVLSGQYDQAARGAASM